MPAELAACAEARRLARSTLRNSRSFQGAGCDVPTRCMKVCAGGMCATKLPASRALPHATSAPAVIFFSLPGLARTRTRCPRANNSLTSVAPMYPVPPLTNTFCIHRMYDAADAVGFTRRPCGPGLKINRDFQSCIIRASGSGEPRGTGALPFQIVAGLAILLLDSTES